MTDEETSIISLEEMRRYLQEQGWICTPSDKSSFDLFSFGRGKNRVEVLLPRVGSSKNPSRWINAGLRTASQLLGQSEAELASTIRALSFDTLRSKIPSDLVRGDTISLTMATDMVRGMRGLLEAAATTELNPAPYFSRVLKAAKVYSDDCRFAHTFKGSFGFVVESPVRVVDAANLPGIEPVPPFERRVIERVARGISFVPIARSANAKNEMLESFGGGLSANMCDALVQLVQVTRGIGVEFAFDFSTAVTSSIPEKTFKSVTLVEDDAEFLRDVAKTMREKRSFSYSEIVGQVVALRTHGIPGDLSDLESVRQITVTGNAPGTGAAEIRVNLKPVDYLVALRAHEEGFALRLQGRLELIGRSWFLLEARLHQELTLFESGVTLAPSAGSPVQINTGNRLSLPRPRK